LNLNTPKIYWFFLSNTCLFFFLKTRYLVWGRCSINRFTTTSGIIKIWTSLKSQCMFGSTMKKVNFDRIDYVKLILIKFDLKIKWFMVRYIHAKVNWTKNLNAKINSKISGCHANTISIFLFCHRCCLFSVILVTTALATVSPNQFVSHIMLPPWERRIGFLRWFIQ
jgi:hypothetical protein